MGLMTNANGGRALRVKWGFLHSPEAPFWEEVCLGVGILGAHNLPSGAVHDGCVIFFFGVWGPGFTVTRTRARGTAPVLCSLCPLPPLIRENQWSKHSRQQQINAMFLCICCVGRGQVLHRYLQFAVSCAAREKLHKELAAISGFVVFRGVICILAN